jgi:DNA-directed RNA polymerase specialized sigma24 family protein
MLDLMDRAISQLREPRREVVRMHLAGYGREEIAELLDCSEATTREALARGMADLRTTLIGMGIRPEGWL